MALALSNQQWLICHLTKKPNHNVCIFIYYFPTEDADVTIPAVVVMVEGGPGTLETVYSSVREKNPVIIVKVCKIPFLQNIWICFLFNF